MPDELDERMNAPKSTALSDIIDQWKRRDELQDAVDRQMSRRSAAVQVNRSGWTDQQWVDDARRLMNEPDGAVTSLLNGHAMAMLRMLDALKVTNES